MFITMHFFVINDLLFVYFSVTCLVSSSVLQIISGVKFEKMSTDGGRSSDHFTRERFLSSSLVSHHRIKFDVKITVFHIYNDLTLFLIVDPPKQFRWTEIRGFREIRHLYVYAFALPLHDHSQQSRPAGVSMCNDKTFKKLINWCSLKISISEVVLLFFYWISLKIIFRTHRSARNDWYDFNWCSNGFLSQILVNQWKFKTKVWIFNLKKSKSSQWKPLKMDRF